MKIEIGLREHIGKEKTDLGVVDVKHDQWMVYAWSDEAPDPKFIGYLGKAKGLAFCPTSGFIDYPVELQDQIVDAISANVGDKRPCGVKPLPADSWKFVDPPEPEDDDVYADEDEEGSEDTE